MYITFSMTWLKPTCCFRRRTWSSPSHRHCTNRRRLSCWGLLRRPCNKDFCGISKLISKTYESFHSFYVLQTYSDHRQYSYHLMNRWYSLEYITVQLRNHSSLVLTQKLKKNRCQVNWNRIKVLTSTTRGVYQVRGPTDFLIALISFGKNSSSGSTIRYTE